MRASCSKQQTSHRHRQALSEYAAHLTATHVTRSLCPNSAQRGRGSSGSGCRPRPAAGRRAGVAQGGGRLGTEDLSGGSSNPPGIPQHPLHRMPSATTTPHTHAPRPKPGLASQTISVVSALPLITTPPSVEKAHGDVADDCPLQLSEGSAAAPQAGDSILLEQVKW